MKNSTRFFHLAQLGFIATSGFSMMLILPIALGGMADQYGFSNLAIGWVAAANSLGIALGALYVPLSGNRFRLQQSIQWSLLGLLFTDIACAFFFTLSPLLWLRFLAGCFGGVVYAGILRAMASLPDAGKGFSIYVSVYCAWAALIFFLAPYVLVWGGVPVLFFYIGLSSLLALIQTSLLRSFEIKAIAVQADTLQYLLRRKVVLGSLISYMLLMAGSGAFWAFIERTGNSHGFSVEMIGSALSTSNLAGIPAGMLAYRLGNRLGVTLPIVAGLFIMALSAFLMGWIPSIWFYGIGAFLFSGAWAFLIAYFQKVQATVDFEGKIVALGATINLLGRAFGPATVGFFLTADSFRPVVWYSLVAFAICLVVVLPVLVKIDRHIDTTMA